MRDGVKNYFNRAIFCMMAETARERHKRGKERFKEMRSVRGRMDRDNGETYDGCLGLYAIVL